LYPLHLHHNEGNELQGPVDVNPANAAHSAAEYFLQDTNQHFMYDDDDSGAISGSGGEINAESSQDCVELSWVCFSAAPLPQDRVTAPLPAPVSSGSRWPSPILRDSSLCHHVVAPESPAPDCGSRAVDPAASADGFRV
jgi:hypothetical protein